MAKLAQTTSKYTIYAKLESEGTVEKPDVIGAVFGQTEGLLGPEMDLRELQRTGRIGRIDVTLETKHGNTTGMITIPSSLDVSETALIAACMETIERVGPCNAKIKIHNVEDVRTRKRQFVIDRAKEILSKLYDEGVMETQEVAEQLKESVRAGEISSYKGLPSGPNLEVYDSVIIVEGRADVIKLLKNGIKNVIAKEGTSVPDALIEISRKKTSTAFLDGDRGGDLNLKELISTCDLDFVARAPRGKEVEDLSKKEIYKALREKVPAEGYKHETGTNEKTSAQRPSPRQDYRKDDRSTPKPEPNLKREIKPGFQKTDTTPRKHTGLDPEKKKRFKEIITELTGTRAAYMLNDKMEIIGKVPVKEVYNTLKELKADVVAFDGNIDQRIINYAASKGVKYIIGMDSPGRIRPPENIKVFINKDL